MGAYDINICPSGAPLLEFLGNVAHSNRHNGLELFLSFFPREKPCEAFVFSGDYNDPYPLNPPVTAEFKSFTAWKNGGRGAMLGQVGAV